MDYQEERHEHDYEVTDCDVPSMAMIYKSPLENERRGEGVSVEMSFIDYVFK